MKYDGWNVAGFDRGEAARLYRSGMNPLLSVVLASRGILDDGSIGALLDGGLLPLSDPLLLKDMEAAAARVNEAVAGGERITVYGDYDVDGITASCLMADYLRSRGADCDIYIPERLEEGYGVKSAALDAIRARGASLVVTVDCGVTAAAEAAHAREIGLDMVITDHHECSGPLPDVPVADPRRPDDDSPAKDLAGVGVAFKLACAAEGPGGTEALLERYGDLVAVGTIADVMPVTGENRTFIRRGLESVRRGDRPGLRELCAAAGLDGKKLSVTGVGFALAPRINAAGRLGSTDTAVQLLLSQDAAEAARLASELCALNRERQSIESGMLAEALEALKADPPEGKPIVLAREGWHQGVAGIVASRLADRFGVPAVMICVKDGVGRGSCRSCGSFNIFGALSACRRRLLSFGGHEAAAGLTIRAEEVDAFRGELRACYEGTAGGGDHPELRVDLELVKPGILTVENVSALGSLEPYGEGNPQPVLCMTGVDVDGVLPLSDGRHTKLWVEKGGEQFEAVFFGKSARELGASEGMSADVAFVPQVNEFRGRRNVQLCLVDFRAHGA